MEAVLARVLVVDDLDLVHDLCDRVLTKAGHQVVHARSGRDAVTMYQQDRPDAVLLDVAMPGFDGFSTLQALRELDPGARVAMLTSHHEHAVVRRAIEMGALDYVAKPFQRERLLAAVERLVGK